MHKISQVTSRQPSSLVLSKLHCTANARLEHDYIGADNHILCYYNVCDVLLLVSKTVGHLNTRDFAMQKFNCAYTK